MHIYPLGTACRVKMNLDNYYINHLKKYDVETQLFDYTLCNFDAVLFQIKNIHTPFTKEEFKDTGTVSVTNHKVVDHKWIFWQIHHEFPNDKPVEEFMPTFLDTFNRRKNRLANIIKTKDKCIHFVHFLCSNNGSPIEIPKVEKIHELFDAFKNICSYSYIHLHLLVHPNFVNLSNQIDPLKINTNVQIHYMRRIGPANPNDNENRLGANWNWIEIFESIRQYDLLLDKVIEQINANKLK